MKQRFAFIVILLLAFTLLAACGGAPEPAPEPSQVDCPACPEAECPTCPEAEACPEAAPCPDCPEAEACPEPVVDNVPYEEAWASSGHADATAEAFRHWDEDDPAAVPASCAKCHSEGGYLDFLGADGSEAGVVSAENHPIDTVVSCAACHNDVTIDKDSVVFPSGLEVTGLGDESRCMECHQGRQSTVSVNEAIDEAGLTEDVDAVSEDLGFQNIHYYAAAATQYGTAAKGGYEYDGSTYDARFAHVEGYDACMQCHNPHTLEIEVEECTACHSDVTSVEDFANIRMDGSLADYDGDGDTEEGVGAEIAGLQEMLLTALQAYAAEVAGAPIAYESHSYPYFFIDTDGDGTASEEEASYGNRFSAWSPRLLKAAYNYQVSQKDPGKFAHGGKYIMQLLYDSISDLNEAISEPVDMSTAQRTDPGHFAGSEEAFRHWDEDGEVPGSCSKCHTAEGLPFFLAEGANVSGEPSNGFRCTTCHENLDDYARYEIEEVEFPSGAVLALEDADSNLCIQCHQGRASGSTVAGRTEGLPDDAVSEALGFINVHYFAAGATLFGQEAGGLYEYDGSDYAGRNAHVAMFDSCIECHSSHELEVEYEACSACHPGVENLDDLASIRIAATDYDGDGDTEEGVAGEIDTLVERLYAGMQAYAADVVGTPIVYESHTYPYFFVDTNGDGVADPDEANYGNRYGTWTPRLLRAAYNFQYAQKDPGAYAHNSKYILQVLYDTLLDMSQEAEVDMTGMVRPQ